MNSISTEPRALNFLGFESLLRHSVLWTKIKLSSSSHSKDNYEKKTRYGNLETKMHLQRIMNGLGRNNTILTNVTYGL